MGDTATRSTGWMTRIEALLARALSTAQNAFSGILALRNVAVTAGALDDQVAPANVIIAAISLTPRASQAGISRWIVIANWAGTTSAADTVTLQIEEAQGPPTAFAGGTVTQAGGGPTQLPTVRFAQAGAVTATSASPTVVAARQSVTTGGAVVTGISCTATCVFVPAPANNPSLVLVTITAANNLSLQGLELTAFELP